jgi:hypothetical protein
VVCDALLAKATMHGVRNVEIFVVADATEIAWQFRKVLVLHSQREW